ncbi:hypothetical protein A9Q84_15305 [Halobacteriovorax marinus]|uniref:Uncharacterized protein n=1 Tax=Halobacteriovorax marinus TaxID=97084 RepID=A0A1Y5FB52_9BACT|nr:hypothetical protein A9Q84_15305 [Halobacteriovorax marinus]
MISRGVSVMKLSILEGEYSVLKRSPTEEIPSWVFHSNFYSISKTDEELSIVCESKYLKEEQVVEGSWRILKVEGPLDFSLTGILSALAAPLAEAKISIFAISTFDTDYLMVKQEFLADAIEVLKKSKIEIKCI